MNKSRISAPNFGIDFNTTILKSNIAILLIITYLFHQKRYKNVRLPSYLHKRQTQNPQCTIKRGLGLQNV